MDARDGGAAAENALGAFAGLGTLATIGLILLGGLFLIVFMIMPQGIVVAIRDRVSKRAQREKAALAESELALAGGEQ